MPARFITFFNQKGGVGKTRLSLELAGTLGFQGYKTLHVDLDTQATATRTSSMAPDDSPFPATVTNLSEHDKFHQELHKQVDMYDFIVIDCPPHLSDKAYTALRVSDLGIIPVGGDAGELWAAKPARQLGLEAQEKNPDLKLRFVSNNAGKTNLAKTVIAELEKDKEVPLMKTRISARNVLKEAVALGQAVVQFNGPKNPARIELENFTREVLQILKAGGAR